jgi:hypothetical protein
VFIPFVATFAEGGCDYRLEVFAVATSMLAGILFFHKINIGLWHFRIVPENPSPGSRSGQALWAVSARLGRTSARVSQRQAWRPISLASAPEKPHSLNAFRLDSLRNGGAPPLLSS